MAAHMRHTASQWQQHRQQHVLRPRTLLLRCQHCTPSHAVPLRAVHPFRRSTYWHDRGMAATRSSLRTPAAQAAAATAATTSAVELSDNALGSCTEQAGELAASLTAPVMSATGQLIADRALFPGDVFSMVGMRVILGILLPILGLCALYWLLDWAAVNMKKVRHVLCRIVVILCCRWHACGCTAGIVVYAKGWVSLELTFRVSKRAGRHGMHARMAWHACTGM